MLKADQLLRFNPNHDDQGRFATAPGDGRTATHPNNTPGGAHYSTALHLSAKQAEMLGKIVD